MEQLQNSVPQCKIVKTLNTLLSAVHNIIKKFRESGEISVHRLKIVIEVCDLWVLSWHCIKTDIILPLKSMHGLG